MPFIVPIGLACGEERVIEKLTILGGFRQTIKGYANCRSCLSIKILYFFEAVLYPEWRARYFSRGRGKQILK